MELSGPAHASFINESVKQLATTIDKLFERHQKPQRSTGGWRLEKCWWKSHWQSVKLWLWWWARQNTRGMCGSLHNKLRKPNTCIWCFRRILQYQVWGIRSPTWLDFDWTQVNLSVRSEQGLNMTGLSAPSRTISWGEGLSERYSEISLWFFLLQSFTFPKLN